jgi:hypothetical protein
LQIADGTKFDDVKASKVQQSAIIADLLVPGI